MEQAEQEVKVSTARAGAPLVGAPLVVGVEGNIGVGKSSLLRELTARNPTWLAVLEPVERWADRLEAAHREPGRLSVDLQRFICRCLVERLPPAETVRALPVILVERSLEASQHVFTRLVYEQGHIDDGELAALDQMFQAEQVKVNQWLGTDLILHLSTGPAVALERVRERGRACEQSLSLGFLHHIHTLHQRWLDGEGESRPVVALDTAELNMAEACRRVEDLIAKTLLDRS